MSLETDVTHLIAYKRLPGPMTSKTLVSIPAFCFLVSSPFPDQSKGEDYIDDNSIRTTVEYTVNEEGKKVKVRLGRTTPLSATYNPNRSREGSSELCRSP
jgi:hypothetical protein